MPPDSLASRELESLRMELAMRGQRAKKPADKPAESDFGKSAGAAANDRDAPAGPQGDGASEQELRSLLADLEGEISGFVEEAEKSITAHSATTILVAMLLGIAIGSLLARR